MRVRRACDQVNAMGPKPARYRREVAPGLPHSVIEVCANHLRWLASDDTGMLISILAHSALEAVGWPY